MVTADVARPGVNWRLPVEWLALALLLLVLMAVFLRYAREVHGQTELAAIRSTVGALRTALVVEHLRQQVAGGSGVAAAKAASVNPFDLVGKLPVGYAGAQSRLEAQRAPAGSWVFAPDCGCVGYRPLDDAWLEATSSDGWVWFALTRRDAVLQLHTKENYRWRGETLD